MKVAAIVLFAAVALSAADQERLDLERKAKWAFDRAILTAQPELAATSGCIQAEAAVLPIAARDQLPVIQYRKGYCLMMAAALSSNQAGFRDAAAAFDQAMSAWPGRVKPAKGQNPEAGPSVLMVLSAVARLDGGIETSGGDASQPNVGLQEDLSIGVGRGTCSAELMTAAQCQSVMRTGKEWLGWQALERGDLMEAARTLADLPDSFWTQWVAGKQSFRSGNYTDAAVKYGAAVELWRNNQARWKANWMARLGPQPRLGPALTDLGGARLLAGEAARAVSTLDSAIATDPQIAQPYYLRARAKEELGQPDAALADYNLAARTAYASAEDLVSGEAHFYRGILMYRRKEFQRAEDEFDSALNTGIAKQFQPDALAWRHLAAVASGSCGASRELLTQALITVSPYFPKADARAVLSSCPGSV